MIDAWIDSLYRFLSNVGYAHPLHPAFVHMPIGLAIGAFVFAWAALLLKKKALAQSARYCSMLSFLFLFPAVLFGVMDWRHFFNGAWLFAIDMKLVLAGILLVLLRMERRAASATPVCSERRASTRLAWPIRLNMFLRQTP